MITPKFPIRHRAAATAAAAKPTPAASAPSPAPVQVPRAPARAAAPARPAFITASKPPAAARPPPPPPTPTPCKRTPEEARAARMLIRTRRVLRAIAALDAREAEIVAFMLEATNGKSWPWPRGVHASLAERLGVSRAVARMYLGALRRTLGLPVRYDLDGPLLKTEAWRRKARRSGDYGSLAPLRPPEAVAAPPSA